MSTKAILVNELVINDVSL